MTDLSQSTSQGHMMVVHYKDENPDTCLTLEAHIPAPDDNDLKETGVDRGLGNLFHVLHDLTDVHQQQNVLMEDPTNYSQMMGHPESSQIVVGLHGEEVLNHYGDCSAVTSSQNYSSCRYQSVTDDQQISIKREPECTDLYSTNDMSIQDDMSDVSTSRIEYVNGRDDKYWDRRRRNNVAAKKSRDARRIRENQLRWNVVCLQKDNDSLKEKNKELLARVQSLEDQLKQLTSQSGDDA